jgi:hypothetical protein
MADEIKTGKQLETEGWQLASISSGEHLKRILEMYHELNFEVYTEEIDAEQCGECTSCYEIKGEKVYKIYTRAINSYGNI